MDNLYDVLMRTKMIWEDRAMGTKNNTPCPLCIAAKNSCDKCPIVYCSDTPYGPYSRTIDPVEKMKYAKDMLLLINAIIEGDVEKVEYYRNYQG
jgi:hypothetical protein